MAILNTKCFIWTVRWCFNIIWTIVYNIKINKRRNSKLLPLLYTLCLLKQYSINNLVILSLLCLSKLNKNKKYTNKFCLFILFQSRKVNSRISSKNYFVSSFSEYHFSIIWSIIFMHLLFCDSVEYCEL